MQPNGTMFKPPLCHTDPQRSTCDESEGETWALTNCSAVVVDDGLVL